MIQWESIWFGSWNKPFYSTWKQNSMICKTVHLHKHLTSDFFLQYDPLLTGAMNTRTMHWRTVQCRKPIIYYPNVLTGHLVFIILVFLIFLQRHKQSHNSVCIFRSANMSVNHNTEKFSIIHYITPGRHRWIRVPPFAKLTRICIEWWDKF